MLLRRAIIAILLSLTMAFLPAVATALARPCVANDMSSSAGNPGGPGVGKAPTACPCEKAMPGCAGMGQCQAGPGCGSQCLGSTGIMSGSEPLTGLAHTRLGFGVDVRHASLSMEPPAPPPRG